MHPILFAQTAAPVGPSGLGQLIMFGSIFAIFYFLVIRPQIRVGESCSVEVQGHGVFLSRVLLARKALIPTVNYRISFFNSQNKR